jgi:hypothetical protein
MLPDAFEFKAKISNVSFGVIYRVAHKGAYCRNCGHGALTSMLGQ